MALVLRVSVPFGAHLVGDIIAAPDMIEKIMGSEHAAHVHKTVLPDHHEAVLPHLAEDHPARQAFMAAVEQGWDPKCRAEDEQVHRAERQPWSEPAPEPDAEEPSS